MSTQSLSTADDGTAPNQPTCKKAKCAVLFCVLVSVMLITLIGGGWMWYQLRAELALQRTTQQQLLAQQQQLQQQVQQQQETLMHYQQQWQAAQQLLGSDTQRWLLLGIAQKIKMANLYLHFTHDARAVSVVLQQIDRQLQRLHNDALLPLRQALASDLARLQGINPPDLPGILSQLSALQERINVLPVQALPTQTTHAATPTESAAANAEWSWRTAWQQTWRALQTIVLVRHHTVPPAPLLDQQQASYLRQNLFLLLQQTKWAALREDTTLYQQSLQQTTQWLQRYFIYAEQATQPIVAQLTQLQQIDIAPTLPTLAASQRAIRDIVHKPVQQQGS